MSRLQVQESDPPFYFANRYDDSRPNSREINIFTRHVEATLTCDLNHAKRKMMRKSRKWPPRLEMGGGLRKSIESGNWQRGRSAGVGRAPVRFGETCRMGRREATFRCLSLPLAKYKFMPGAGSPTLADAVPRCTRRERTPRAARRGSARQNERKGRRADLQNRPVPAWRKGSSFEDSSHFPPDDVLFLIHWCKCSRECQGEVPFSGTLVVPVSQNETEVI